MTTKKTIAVNGDTVIVEFPKSGILNPLCLISLTKDYYAHLPELMKVIKKSIEKTVKLRLNRMKLDGNIIEKVVSVKIIKVLNKNTFTVETIEDLESKYGEPHALEIRTDNALGIIPTLPDRDHWNLFQLNSEKLSLEYFKCLFKIKETLRTCFDKKHKVTLTYKGINFKTKIIDCSIIKVNKSNLVLKEIRNRKYLNGDIKSISITLGRGERTLLHVTPEYFLFKCSVTIGSEHSISLYDEGET